MGIAVLRTKLLLRAVAVLLLLDLPMGFGGMALMELVVGQQHWIGVGAILPLCAAVVLIGVHLRTETPDTVSTVPSPNNSGL